MIWPVKVKSWGCVYPSWHIYSAKYGVRDVLDAWKMPCLAECPHTAYRISLYRRACTFLCSLHILHYCRSAESDMNTDMCASYCSQPVLILPFLAEPPKTRMSRAVFIFFTTARPYNAGIAGANHSSAHVRNRLKCRCSICHNP